MRKDIKPEIPTTGTSYEEKEKQEKKKEIERLAGIINRRLDFFRIVKA